MKDKIRILFFTPYASRTGSEVMLWYIFKHFDRSKFEMAVVSFRQGELLSELPADVKYFHIPESYSITQKLAFHLGWNPTQEGIKAAAKAFKADLWYINTIMLPFVIDQAKRLNIPVVTHVHELGHMFASTSVQNFRTLMEDSNLLIGCSQIVCDILSDSGAKNVKRLYSFVDLESIQTSASSVESIRNELGAGPSDFIWAMSGTTSERKGFDLLPDLAKELPQDRTLHLMWVGRLLDDGLTSWIQQRCAGIKNVHIHFVGAQNAAYYDYLAAADGFMMTSRQEPFGLVMVEAAWLGKPIVAFESGGPQEFIKPGMGTLIPCFDLKKFSAAMLEWRKKSEHFDTKTAQNHCLSFGTRQGMANWCRIIEDFYQKK
ncbi:glycosyltransferase family 4 protein [Dyadobacter tibetensis]|uniref:glycosyltransferase family 4 protein n=1 Tax=Dyadobacter tibetensis TaxID=1211851 RepID=UPI00046FD082|nr:glycosyltransferase family 4 protein [Dyadobacter tibetensis]